MQSVQIIISTSARTVTYSQPVNCLRAKRSPFKFSANRVKLIEHEMHINHNIFSDLSRAILTIVRFTDPQRDNP